MQLIVFSCVFCGLTSALWNALKPFSATGLQIWPHTGGGGDTPRPPQECVLYKMPQERTWWSRAYLPLSVHIFIEVTVG